VFQAAGNPGKEMAQNKPPATILVLLHQEGVDPGRGLMKPKRVSHHPFLESYFLLETLTVNGSTPVTQLLHESHQNRPMIGPSFVSPEHMYVVGTIVEPHFA
jgi:hypothetical protein